MRTFLTLIISMLMSCEAFGQRFDEYFTDSTLRLDYIFAGDNHNQYIFFHEATQTPGWYGRRSRLSETFLLGNGQLTLRDTLTHNVIYTTTFSTLFQEWQTEEEATHVKKSFENSYIVPFPKEAIEVTVTLRDTHHKITSEMKHVLSPDDILISIVE